MTAKAKTFEYLLLFRGNNWTEDLSPEENKIAKFTWWFERVRNSGIFKSGHPLEHNDKIVTGRNAVTNDPSGIKAIPAAMARLQNPRE